MLLHIEPSKTDAGTMLLILSDKKSKNTTKVEKSDNIIQKYCQLKISTSL